MIYKSEIVPVWAPEELRTSLIPKTRANSGKVKSIPAVPSVLFPPTL